MLQLRDAARPASRPWAPSRVRSAAEERAIPRCGYELCDAEGNTIGNVTSGIMLPTTKVGIGMGYVQTAFAKKETIIYVKIREKLIPAKIV